MFRQIKNSWLSLMRRLTQQLSPRKPLAVMVWIHGGGFKFGDSSEMLYGPDYLLSKDIVFVSLNYRLGVLGKCYKYFT